MPIYEYLCQQCGSRFESLRSMKDADAVIQCTRCASEDTRRVVSACFSKTAGSSGSQSSSSGCGGCSGGSCSSCGH